LESALARPQHIAPYEADADVARLAAAYAFGISKNHPFIDGNKRVAIVAMRTFLLLNGFTLNAPQSEKYLMIMALAEDRSSEKKLAKWIRTNLRPVND
jgi:death-on-curing protein